ncbi:MAG: alpha/beta hydrolase [Spirochaetales bacterium]|nr:alpha/beta hydrolase [Spirochaetales bacterium]
MVKKYLEYYGIPDDYLFKGGEFSVGQYTVWSWSLEPEKWERTVVVLHGFLDHSLINRKLILSLLVKGYRVIAGDMPGHGRSSGIRGGINSFADYDIYFKTLLDYWQIDPSSSYAVGHSTGSSLLINYSRERGTPFCGFILAAPLVKMNFHSLLDRGIDLAQDWIKVLPVQKTKSSSNKAFLRFKRKDPLGVKRFSLDWIKAMVDWNREWADFTSSQPVLIVQGKKDNVVEWRTNLPILENCFTDCRVIYHKKGRHHILNESERIRREVYNEIIQFMENH